jgi:hypothetical protein
MPSCEICNAPTPESPCARCRAAEAFALLCPNCGSTFAMPSNFIAELRCPHCGRTAR